MKATAKDLRFHSKELIDSVRRGEEIVITFRGKPCAKLVPYQELKNKESDLREAGFDLTPKRGKFALPPEGTRLSCPCCLN